MITGIRVTKVKGELVPDKFWETALASGMNVWGAAYAEEGKIYWQAEAGPTLAGVNELQELLSDHDVNFYLGKHDGESHEDDLQPYVIQADNDDKPLVMAIIEGNCEGFAQAGSARPDVYFAIENAVVPDFLEVWEISEGNPEALYKAIKRPARQVALQNIFTTRGSLTLICADGSFTHIEKDNELGAKFDWGTVSNTLGYTETVEEPEAQVSPPAQLSMAEKFKQQAGKLKTVKRAASSEPVATVVPPTTAKPVVVASVTPLVKNPQRMMTFQIPASWNNKQKKRVFNGMLGCLPHDWHKLKEWTCEAHKVPQGVVAVEAPVKDLKDLSTALKATTAPVPATQEPLPAQVIEPKKDVEPHHILPSEERPLIPVSQRKDFHEKFLNSVAVKEILNRHSSPILTLEEMQEYEKKEPSFSEQTGLDIEKTFRYPHAELKKLCVDYPDLAAVLLGTYRLGYMKQWKSPTQVQASDTTDQKDPFKKVKTVKRA